jgi:MFS family permease
MTHHGRSGAAQVRHRVRNPDIAPYDLRKTVSITAPIVGSVGGFVVTAVVLVLTVATKAHHNPAQLALTSGLLAVALVGCLVGAFSLASLGGEPRLTVNLMAAATFMSAGPTIALAAILAAFQILASLYLPSAGFLFAFMVALVGAAGGVFNCTMPLDEWDIRAANLYPNAPPEPGTWIVSRRHAKQWCFRLGAFNVAPIVLGFVFYAAGATFALPSAGVTAFVSTGMVLVVGLSLFGLLRSLHPDHGHDRGTCRWEALVIHSSTGAYIGAMLLFLH